MSVCSLIYVINLDSVDLTRLEKRHYLFPPATSLFSSPSISETDGESSSLQQEIIVSENERNFHWLLSSKESTSSQSLSSSQQGKKLIYQVVV